MTDFITKYRFQILLGAILLVHILGMTNDIFNGDSALYASIARNIAESGDWLILNSVMQESWIDKPHLPFWIWAVFIKVFGNTNFGFKLPSLLALLVLLRYVFLFSKKHYDESTAWTGVVILSSSLHIFISTNDVRIDIFLIAFMMGAIYHLQIYLSSHQLIQLLIGAFLVAMAVMTKGIFVVIPIGVSVLVTIWYQKKFRWLLSWHWLLAALVFLGGILPALYALKVQFAHFTDSHILGQKVSNYLQFFFWDSQFGRFNSNLGQVQSNGDPTFYLHTLLWSFAPWSLILLMAFFLKKNPFKEYISTACFAVLFVIISISKTQLSHHVLILLPFLSIILAVIFRVSLWRLQHPFLLFAGYVFFFLILIAGFYLTNFILGIWIGKYIIVLILVVSILFFMSKFLIEQRIFILFTSISLFLGLFLNTILYPEILKYQAGKVASDFLKKNPKYSVVEEFYANISLLNFYSPIPLKNTKLKNMDELLMKQKQILYTNDYGVSYLEEHNVNYRILDSFYDYRTTVLSLNFLRKSSRENELEKLMLVEINPI
jgi:4-amino-4-deoxy-L-arabinose transferase-like glycosyltransferase